MEAATLIQHSLIPIKRRAGSKSEPVWTLWRREKSGVSWRESNHDSQALQTLH